MTFSSFRSPNCGAQGAVGDRSAAIRRANSAGGTVTFAYDPFGRRIKKVVSSTSTTSIFAYDGDNLAEEANSAGTVVARYAQHFTIDEPLAMSRSGATAYYQADGLGTVTSLSSSAGAVAQTYSFDSFGKQTTSTGSLTNPFQYAGREFDTETNLYSYRVRYYDSSVGRFLSEDPVRFASGNNFYQYVDNRPLDLVDPFGLFPSKVPFRWRLCSTGEIAFCIQQCAEQGKKYESCRFAQTFRIKVMIQGKRWYDIIGDPSCSCEDLEPPGPIICPELRREPAKQPQPKPQPDPFWKRFFDPSRIFPNIS